jgi:hypothetical protein
LIELLGLGKTYPLQDLPVRGEQLTVAPNVATQIFIDDSQPGVIYQLFDGKNPVELALEGNGARLGLKTPPITEDITYRILARKIGTDLQAYLHQSATIAVGLDTTLKARVLDAPALDPAIHQPADGDPRIVAYGADVTVQVDATQDGVSYRLIQGPGVGNEPEKVISEQDVTGTLGNIHLRAKPDAIVEDMDIRVRATRTFQPADGQPATTDSALLNVVLPLKVRARTDVPVAVAPSPVVGYGQDAAIKIGQTQASVTYRLYVHRILDGEFVHGETKDPVILVKTEGDPVQVRFHPPSPPAIWADTPGWVTAGDAQSGNGGDLTLTLKGPVDDRLVIVRAEKSHAAPGGTPIPSAVQLKHSAVVLVRPDPARALRLRVIADDSKSSRSMQVSGGQPGVFYRFRSDPGGTDIALPAYFHKRDEANVRLNKGLGQLAIEVDLAIATDPPLGGPSAPTSRAELPPVPPILDLAPLNLDATLHVHAVKAQTQVAADLDKMAQVPSLPEIRPEQSPVDYGAKASLRVIASRVGETYQPLFNEQPVADAKPGDGKDLAFTTPALTDGETYVLLVTRPADPGLAVKRVLNVSVAVRPRADLAVTAAASAVDLGGATVVRVDSSQPGVSYRLNVGDQPVGQSAIGNGGSLSFPTGPIARDTTFVVRAARTSDPAIAVALTQQAVVTVRPIEPPRQPPADPGPTRKPGG